MSEHLSTETIDQYCRRSMSASELLAAGDHLEICEVCRRQAIDAIGAPSILSSLRARLHVEAASDTSHVSYEQLGGFVDGKLKDADRKLVESHLDDCAACADEVNDLRSFRTTITTPIAETELKSSGVGQRLRSLWGTWALWNPRFAAVSALALLLVCVTGVAILVWKMRSREVTDNRSLTEVTNVPSPGSEPSPQASTPPNTTDVENANAQVALNDAGDRITMDKEGNITGLEALSPSVRSVVSQALKTERVETSRDLSELSGRTGVLLGDQNQSVAQVLLNPVGIVLRGDRPRFRWRAVAGASSYTVNVLDSDFNILATSLDITATSWNSPASLPRGKVLSWQVTAVKDGQKVVFPSAPAPEARFKILELEKDRELTRAEKIQPRSHLALGTLYARAGLLDDAEREMRALAAANPESTTARKLLRSIQTLKSQNTKPKH